MKPVRIYYQSDDTDQETSGQVYFSRNKNMIEYDQPEEGISFSSADTAAVPESEKIVFFPGTDYGEFDPEFRALEQRYNSDRSVFFHTDYHDPELIPAADQLRDTVEKMLRSAKLLFDRFGEDEKQKSCALEIMNQCCRDCFSLEDEVSKHAKLMMMQYPDDEILREDMREIDEDFLDFYLKAYHIRERYKKK